MEIRVLRYFLTVFSEESITKASEVLHITRPTLSRQLAQLEEEIGIKLIDMGSRFKAGSSRRRLVQTVCLQPFLVYCVWKVVKN